VKLAAFFITLPAVGPGDSLKNISKKGPRNRRSLGCARDDKKERVFVRQGRLSKERAGFKGGGTPVHQQLPSPSTVHPLDNSDDRSASLGMTKERATVPLRVVTARLVHPTMAVG
jgi:hypothetical protein